MNYATQQQEPDHIPEFVWAAFPIGLESVSEWHVISQEQVADYAGISGDGRNEWVHLDPQKAAAELPYGGTIVQGFLQVAHLTSLYEEAMQGQPGVNSNHALNYGFDRLRFVNPLPVGGRFRARIKVGDVRRRQAGGYFVKQDVVLELDNGAPTLVAEWLFHVSDRAFQNDS